MAKSKKPPPPRTPKTPKPWDSPPRAEIGDDTDEQTFAAIGRALSAWETFEISMASLFAALLGITTGNWAASRAYGSVLTSKGRTDMVQAAAEARFLAQPDKAVASEVAGILEAARGYSGRRNEIAHGIVKEMFSFDFGKDFFFGSVERTRWGWAVVPADYATNKSRLLPPIGLLGTMMQIEKYAYTSAEIATFTAAFADLAKRTDDVKGRVLRHVVASERDPSP